MSPGLARPTTPGHVALRRDSSGAGGSRAGAEREAQPPHNSAVEHGAQHWAGGYHDGDASLENLAEQC
ncbi:hypothetical protein CPLU01_07864 [Colletotrichum plurivorum]|uniref:Uncharacterized protein n=1 Tax=Colletotrichum plurivorum TaxID=2175906 RepID=A0A8H6NE58_9PEZI|nr:hypothetical protein CPLU01_07864 [Colletotrichum plurivorum]